MSDTLTATDPYGPLVLGDIMKQYDLAIGKAMSAIWDKEIAFQGAPAFQYKFLSNSNSNWFDETVSYEGVKISPSKPVEDDVRAREIESRLNALGSHGRDVAKSLARQNITGIIGAPSRCAIAEWFRKNFESYGAVSVGPATISLLGTDGTHFSIATPPAVRDFIRMFDAGVFPELIAENFRRLQQSLANYQLSKEGSTHASVPGAVPEFVPSL